MLTVPMSHLGSLCVFSEEHLVSEATVSWPGSKVDTDIIAIVATLVLGSNG